LWHPSRNDDRSPGDYKHASNKRVWLQCHGCPDCGEVHEWDARVKDLTQYGGDLVCPYCKSRGRAGKFCSCRSVVASDHLAAEWHQDNPPPNTVAVGSNDKKYKWTCPKAQCGHVWKCAPRSRSTYGTHCPECTRRNNGLINHASLADGRPDLVCEWDEERNGFSSSCVTCGSRKKVFWICKMCGVGWKAKIADRALRGSVPVAESCFSGGLEIITGHKSFS
jgi:hypothetical protein